VSDQKINPATHITIPVDSGKTKSSNTSKISNQAFIDTLFNNSQDGISALSLKQQLFQLFDISSHRRRQFQRKEREFFGLPYLGSR
jgi:hypothetical protein